MNYYNEFDPFAASWLRELIKDGLIPEGEVDERSIIEVEGSDLKDFTQCHFFAGIGGWSYALQLAGWDATRPVWTGSLPCQPFSVAGKQFGKNDERHLLPHFMSLVRQCRPDTIMGEQVEGAIKHGWLDDLQTTMEKEGYSTGAVVLGAHSVNQAHIRQRIYWVAGRVGNADSSGLRRQSENSVLYREGAKPDDQSTEGCSSTLFTKCRDDKLRPIPVEPTLQPMFSNGISNRVGLLRGAGNAIAPAVAAEVIKAVM